MALQRLVIARAQSVGKILSGEAGDMSLPGVDETGAIVMVVDNTASESDVCVDIVRSHDGSAGPAASSRHEPEAIITGVPTLSDSMTGMPKPS